MTTVARTFAVLLFGAVVAIASPAQTFTTLLNFNSTNGANPQGMSIIQGTDGRLYGTTRNGGTSRQYCPSGCGTVFKLTPTGKLTSLSFSYCPQVGCTSGATPLAGMIQATNGSF
jgi:uncharacterized repeat protein (TIGR03803 family)